MIVSAWGLLTSRFAFPQISMPCCPAPTGGDEKA